VRFGSSEENAMEILKRDVTAKSYPIIFGYRFGNMPPSAT
jgi:hypothetical protein